MTIAIEQPIFAMNPYVDIHIDPPPEAIPIDPSRVETITTRCPVRGRGLVIRDLTRTADPELFAFFLEVVARGGELDLDSDSPLVEPLARIGFLVTEEDIIEWPRFAIPLDMPLHTDGTDAWIVADSFLFQPAFELHPAIPWPADYDEQEGRLHCFAPGPAFWVGDPSAFVAPRWVTPEAAVMLADFTPGTAPPPLPPTLASALAAVGVLVPRAGAPADTLARFADCRSTFASERHVVVRDLLSAGELAALRRYYVGLLTGGLVQFSDGQCAARFSTYNDPVGRFVHARLAAAMSVVTGQPVAPSFSYFFSYVDGAVLDPHKDRPQAEFSISLQIDYSPTPAAETGWPLCFSFDDGRTVAPELRIGDAVLYHGRELTHFRSRLPPGHQSSHLVLEYVPRDFRGLLI